MNSSHGFGGAGRTNRRFESADFTHASFGYNRSTYGHDGDGRRYGSGRHGYGHDWYHGGWHSGGGGGWYGGGDGFWFLDDLFGLALNFSALALNPWSPVASLGWNLLDTSVQALGNLDNYDQESDDYDAKSYPVDQQYYPALCGNYYSDENPGCVQ